jgi:CheY-like chemotaxis protein
MEHALSGRSILIVEDEPLISLLIAEAFAEVGASTIVKSTLAEAVAAAEGSGFSAAIVDHGLSDGETTKLCQRLAERKIPYVVYSGYPQPVGAHGVFVTKPASPEVLVTAIEGLLRIETGANAKG